ncbi:hypothetical protein [Halorarius litoreus]|uniref:hypothetical protein n=1 Tax=Halorarius litoreus TaxID=2962676 RepID=UPI0020CF6517|nr:hypothetical protein [Halorarius litoreus]
MNVRSVGILLLALAVGVGGFVVFFLGVGMPVSHTSYYQYDGTIATNETLHNVTVYLPLPTENGAALVDAANVTVETEDGAADWDVAVVDTPHGPMLALTADRVEGERYYLVHEFDENGSHVSWEKVPEDELPADMTNKKAYPEPTYYRFSVSVWLDDRVDVVDPVANASVLRPVENLTPGACEPYWENDENAACATFETPAYVQYDTTADNVVRLSVEQRGVNEWGYGLSNSFNEFVQEAEGHYAGSQDGWVTMEGQLYTGLGDETR